MNKNMVYMSLHILLAGVLLATLLLVCRNIPGITLFNMQYIAFMSLMMVANSVLVTAEFGKARKSC